MSIKATAQAGSPLSATLRHPYRAPALPPPGGVPMGPQFPSRRLFWINLHEWQQAGLIDSTTMNVHGNKNSGKSVFGKVFVDRSQLFQAPDYEGNIHCFRCLIHDRKREGKDGEYTELTRKLGCDVIRPAELELNIFDLAMNMDEFNILRTAYNICEKAHGGPLINFQPLALQVAVFKMWQHFREAACVELLVTLAYQLDMSDLRAFRQHDKNELARRLPRLAQQRRGLEEELRPILAETRHNVPRDAFLHDAALVGSYLESVLRGKYGRMFRGEGSLRAALTKALVTIDWTGASDEAKTLLLTMLRLWQNIAQENGDFGIMPYIVLGDEEATAMDDLHYVRTRSDDIITARARWTIDIGISQNRIQTQALGNPASELRRKAEGIARGVGCTVYGTQPDDDDVLHDLHKNTAMRDQDIYRLTQLGTGVHALNFTGTDSVFYFQTRVVPSERDLIQSNRASQVMVDGRRNVYDDPNVQRRLAAISS